MVLVEQPELILTGQNNTNNDELLWEILKHILAVSSAVRLPKKQDEEFNVQVKDFVYENLDKLKEKYKKSS